MTGSSQSTDYEQLTVEALEAAARSATADDRKFHLNRAAVYAFEHKNRKCASGSIIDGSRFEHGGR